MLTSRAVFRHPVGQVLKTSQTAVPRPDSCGFFVCPIDAGCAANTRPQQRKYAHRLFAVFSTRRPVFPLCAYLCQSGGVL